MCTKVRKLEAELAKFAALKFYKPWQQGMANSTQYMPLGIAGEKGSNWARDKNHALILSLFPSLAVSRPHTVKKQVSKTSFTR